MVEFNDLASLEAEPALGDVAAFIIEPIQGKGVNLHSPGYLAEASRLCRKHGALLVCDEVQTGVGRTGTFLAIDQEQGVEPDMVIMSKALSGGQVPVGAVLVRGGVWKATFSSLDRAIVHSSTFHMGTLAMVAGLSVLHAYDACDAAGNAQRMGTKLMDGLRAMQPRVEFGQPKSLALRASWAATHAMDRNLFAQSAIVPLMEDHRIICQVAGHNLDVVKLIPPLVIDESDVQWFLAAFESVLESMHRPMATAGLLARLGRNTLRSMMGSAE